MAEGLETVGLCLQLNQSQPVCRPEESRIKAIITSKNEARFLNQAPGFRCDFGSSEPEVLSCQRWSLQAVLAILTIVCSMAASLGGDLRAAEPDDVPSLVGEEFVTCRFCLLPDSKRIAYPAPGYNEHGEPVTILSVADVDGSNQKVVGRLPGIWGVNWCGKDRIACTEVNGNQIQVFTLDDGRQRTVSIPDRFDVFYPEISPDGSSMVFDGYQFDVKAQGVFVVDMGTGRVRQLSPDLVRSHIAWSSDSKRLAYGAGGYGTNYNLKIVDVESGAITDTGINGVGVAFSPDGKWIAYAGDLLKGHAWYQGVPYGSRVVKANLQTKEVLPLTEPAHPTSNPKMMAGAGFPSWSPDGRWIAYRRPSEGNPQFADELWVVGADGLNARKLYNSWAPTVWMPDSASILMKDRQGIKRIALRTGEVSGLITFEIERVKPIACATVPAPAMGSATNRATGPSSSFPATSLRVVVDPRVELMSLIFRLAGNPEYNMAKVASYAGEVDKKFGTFRDHAVVTQARELVKSRGISFDAVMSMAIHLTDVEHVGLRLPLEPWPEGLDQRWTAPDVTNFIADAQQFVKDASFPEFIEQHQPFYQTAVARMRALISKEAHLEWFDAFFGQRPQANFNLALGMLNGGGCYGPHFQARDGREELWCIFGVWQTDKQGLPEFTYDMLETVTHEFCHSYANPIVTRHLAELQTSGDTLYKQVAERMRAQAYGNGETLLFESLVRVCVIRNVRQFDGEEAARRAIQAEKNNGFLWMQELSDLLGEYEAHRQQYVTLDDFSPRLVAFFAEAVKSVSKQQAELANRRPKIVSMIPANGAQDVDPSLSAIQVVFDRAMADNSWSFVGEGPHYPAIGTAPHYDIQRKVWSVPVNLTPDWSYEFSLNSEDHDEFRSEDGTPLEPVPVSFKTAGPRSPR